MLPPLDLARIRESNLRRRARKEASTPGPWEAEDDWVMGPDERIVADTRQTPLGLADAVFIAAARSDPVEDDVDRLCEEVERLRAENAELRARPCVHELARQFGQAVLDQEP